MRKKRNTTKVVRASGGPFDGERVLLTHSGGVIDTAVFRVGQYVGKYAGRVTAPTGAVTWMPSP